MKAGIINGMLVVVLCVGVVSMAQAGGIIYVDAAAAAGGDGSSWAKAYTDLPDGLAAAADANKPVEIRVAAGTYRPKLTKADATFQLLNGITLKGGYAGLAGSDPDARDVQLHTTILSGDYSDSTSHTRAHNVVTGSGTDATAVIDGFTISGGASCGIYASDGNPTVTDCTFKGDMFWGFRSTGGSDVALTRCSFVEILHSAVDIWDANSTLTGCSFVRSGYTAVECIVGNLTVKDCTFTENARGVIDCMMGSVDLIGCTFTANGRQDGLRVVDCRNVTAHGCKFISNAGWLSGAIDAMGDVLLVDCEFIGNKGRAHAGAVSTFGRGSVIANGCVFAGNSCSTGFGGGAIYGTGGMFRLSNCTFVGNRGKANSVRFWPSDISPKLTQCIIWDEPNPFITYSSFISPDVSVTYSDVQGGWPGEGNIDVDPCFVDPGHWDLNGTPNDANDDLWVAGNYHLKSQAGHWDQDLEDWVYDDTTSRCIDAGDSNAAVGAEPFPNGGYVNLGAYGGTVEASRTYFGGPVCPVQMAGDINGDCKVDNVDKAILMQHWMMEGWDQINQPPVICLISPQDGAELTNPTPIVLRVDASDPDGQILRVSYTLVNHHGNGTFSLGTGTTNPTDGWKVQIDWSHMQYDGVYTITAEVMDDEGARTTSTSITVTLHPSSTSR